MKRLYLLLILLALVGFVSADVCATDGFVAYKSSWIISKSYDQTFQTIAISGAQHLDKNRNYISDIYEDVRTQDTGWSETIRNKEYVRVNFEKNLTNKNDITIYARSGGNESATIMVYRENGTDSIAKFENIALEGWHKIYLTDLLDNESYDVFDLLVISKSGIEFDYIVDPTLSWWNNSWTYRKTFNVSENSGVNLNNFQVNITVDTQALINLSKMNSNCSDIRFTNANNTPISYYIKSGCNSTTTQIWIKTNLTASINNTFYMYYGNSTAVSQSNGTTTFDFFDDFSGDLSKWAKEKMPGNLNIVNGYLNISNGTTSAPYGHSSLGSNASYTGFGNSTIEGVAYLTTNSIAEIAYRGAYTANTGYKSRMDARTGEGISNLKPPYTDGSWAFIGTQSGTACAISTWLPFSITANGSTQTIQACGQSKITTDATYSSPGEISLQNHYGSYSLFDNITVRKFASKMPTFNFGNEDKLDLIYPQFYSYYDNNGTLIFNGIGLFNVSVNYTNGTVLLEINNTNITATNLYSNVYNASYFFSSNGTYSYRWLSWGNGSWNNYNVSYTRNYTVNSPASYPPIINLSSLTNNTIVTYKNIAFLYSVDDVYDNVSKCSLIIDTVFVLNTSITPLPKNTSLNFTYNLTNGQHNWSIWCNDSGNYNSTSEVRNITIKITPVITYINLTDGSSPDGQIMLSAGTIRKINCTATATDPEGVTNILNATAIFYYYTNNSNDPDNNNTHYTNSSCNFSNTSTEKTFNCGFDVWYYANNGTWNCNVTVYNNYSNSGLMNVSSVIQPLYAVNITDGMSFNNVQSNIASNNITVNITNFGNMPVNVTLQGYALTIGDNTGMNCSDGTNITITNIRFSTNNTADFGQKTPMTGAIQPLIFQIKKQINSTSVFNTTYWQINPDPGTANRLCGGYVIFSAEAP